MDRRSNRDVPDRQGVARLDRRFRAGNQSRTNFHPFGSDDVAALTIGIAQQCDMGGAVRVVLKTLNLRRNAIFVTAKVNQAVLLLVPAAMMTHCNVAIIIAPSTLAHARGQRINRTTLVQMGIDQSHLAALPRCSGLHLYERHVIQPPLN